MQRLPQQGRRQAGCAGLNWNRQSPHRGPSSGEDPRLTASPLFSPRGEPKCVRGASVRGARRLTNAGVLEQYVEYGEQAQRSSGGPIACFGRQVVRNAGQGNEQASAPILENENCQTKPMGHTKPMRRSQKKTTTKQSRFFVTRVISIGYRPYLAMSLSKRGPFRLSRPPARRAPVARISVLRSAAFPGRPPASAIPRQPNKPNPGPLRDRRAPVAQNSVLRSAALPADRPRPFQDNQTNPIPARGTAFSIRPATPKPAHPGNRVTKVSTQQYQRHTHETAPKP